MERTNFKIKDISLADWGRKEIELAEVEMPGLLSIRKEYKDYFLNEKTDDEIVNETDIDQILFKISVNTWKLICKNDLQPLILNKYDTDKLNGVFDLLTKFKDFESLEVEIEKDIPILKTAKDYD